MSLDESQREVRPEEEFAGPGKEPSVAEMAPAYPRQRDFFIKGVALLVLVLLFCGGYLLIRGTGTAWEAFKKNPVEFVSSLIWGEGIFGTCQSFVREHEKLFGHLGKDVKLTMIRQEVSVVNRAKTAKIVASAQGETERETVFFFLERRKGKWQVATVASRTRKGEYKALYPNKNAPSDKI